MGQMINRRRYIKVNAKPYLKFTALEDGTFKHNTDDLEYSINGGRTWNLLPANTFTPTIHTGETIYWRGTMSPGNKNQYFVSTGRFDASGDPLSLCYKNKFVGKSCRSFQFNKLFQNCTNLINAKDLVISDSFNGSSAVCLQMFEGCTNLITAPELPATTLTPQCYQNMFYNCTSLITPPNILPALTTAQSCYSNMFGRCTSLTYIPNICIVNQQVNTTLSMFSGCTNLADIVLREGLTIIDGSMFQGCTNLRSIYIPSSINSINSSAFFQCSSLKTVNISNLNSYLNISLTNTYACPTCYGADLYLNGIKVTEVTLNKADQFKFYMCKSLQNVTLNEGITEIEQYIFTGCDKITEITLPSTLKIIGPGAFRQTGITSIIIPQGVTTIGMHAFHSCPINYVTIPSSVTFMDDNCFYGIRGPGEVHITDIDAWCKIDFHSLQSGTNPLATLAHLFLMDTEVTNITVPNDVVFLKNQFPNMVNLDSITLPEGLTTIGFNTFNNCNGLTSITIPSTVTTIGTYAFYYARNITKLELPSGVTNIGGYAFSWMSRLVQFICNATIPPTLENTSAFWNNNCTIYVPDNSVNAYKTANNWSTYADRIKGISELPE